MYHNPDAEGMINRMDNIKKNFDNSRLHDLDDHEQRKFLETNGLIVNAGQSAQFKAVENPSTGYKWQIDQESCKEWVHISSEYIAPPDKKGKDPHADDEMSGMGSRGSMMGIPGHTKFTIKAGAEEGRCIFRIALARPGEFTGFEAMNNINKIEIPIMIQKSDK